jgi:hypothetical protein
VKARIEIALESNNSIVWRVICEGRFVKMRQMNDFNGEMFVVGVEIFEIEGDL